MPPVKKAHIRYRAIDECLSNFQKMFFIEDIVKKCNEALFEFGQEIKERQVYEDMKFMEEDMGFGVEIARIQYGKKKYFRYTSREMSILGRELLIDAKELSVLKSAIEVLQKVKGLPHYEWLEEVSVRFLKHFNKDKIKKEIIDFEDNSLLKGKDYLEKLFQYILEEKVLQMQYHPFTEPQPLVWTVHPYYLKQHNHRWFCLAYVPQKGEICVIALDRIVSMREIEAAYQPNVYENFEARFKDVIGVTRFKDEEVTEVRFRIAPERAPYIDTKPLHESQVRIEGINDVENWQHFLIKVRYNHELSAKILQLGDHIEVLSPPKLREEIGKRLQSAADRYK